MPDTLQAEPRPAPVPAGKAEPEMFLDRIAALVPQIRARAAETERLLENASAKLLRKGLDAIVANDVGRAGTGFAADTNAVTVLSRNGERLELSGTKREVAEGLWDFLLASLELPARASR